MDDFGAPMTSEWAFSLRRYGAYCKPMVINRRFRIQVLLLFGTQEQQGGYWSYRTAWL